MTINPNSPQAKDIAYQLHAFTDARAHEREGPLVVTSASGVYVTDDEGKRYLEAMAGLWCVSLGFSEPRLKAAADRQFERLPYYHTFNHKAGAPSIELAERLADMAPGRMGKVFFANSGSEANDTAVKLVRLYNNACGRPQKKKIISRMKAYHGVTVATASLTGLPKMHGDFDLPMPGVLHASCPHHYAFAQDGESEESFASRLAEELDDLIRREDPETVAAFIGEPVMGAGGVIVPPRTYWEKIQRVLKKYDVLLIADEVICGFGRTGKMFGCETFAIEPDMVTVAKGLSSGYLPISAVLMSDEVYQAVADASHRTGTFGHGFTYSGHPVSVAVAMETLDIYEERDILAHVASVAPRLQDGLRAMTKYPLVGEVRGLGLVAGVQLVADRERHTPLEPPGLVGAHLLERCHEQGLIVRTLGDDVMTFAPPLVIAEAEIDDLLERFERALADTQAWAEREGRTQPV